jgi:hypothetical protein
MVFEAKAGSVRVLCRIAPLQRARYHANNRGELVEMQGETWELQVAIDGAPPEQTLYTADPYTGASATTGCTAVLDSDCDQPEAFNAIAAPLVAKAVAQGANVAVLAYGQTSSGKTHTMFGPDGGTAGYYSDPETVGVIPRVIDAIFSLEATHAHGITGVDVAFFEIHNETAIDHVARCFNEAAAPPPPNAATRSANREMSYLASSRAASASAGSTNGGGSQLPVTYRPTERSKLLRSLQKARCSTAQECHDTLGRLSESRLTAETEMNLTSSRSHVVIQLSLLRRISVRNGDSKAPLRGGSITLVDLAGSESLKASAAPHLDPSRMQESRGINVSLLALKKVVRALATRAAYVPYKDSTLTVVLEPCLESAATALVCCCSVDRRDAAETLATVKFASEASRLTGRRGDNAAAAMRQAEALVNDKRRIDSMRSLRSRHQQVKSRLPFGQLAPKTGLVDGRRAHRGHDDDDYVNSSWHGVSKGLDFSSVEECDEDEYDGSGDDADGNAYAVAMAQIRSRTLRHIEQQAKGAASRSRSESVSGGVHRRPSNGGSDVHDEDDIETARLDDDDDATSTRVGDELLSEGDQHSLGRQPSASPLQKGRDAVISPQASHLRLIASLQERVRILTDHNTKLQRENAAAKQEVQECKDGAKTLLMQCDRLATQFTAIKDELEESKRREAEQESVIADLREQFERIRAKHLLGKTTTSMHAEDDRHQRNTSGAPCGAAGAATPAKYNQPNSTAAARGRQALSPTAVNERTTTPKKSTRTPSASGQWRSPTSRKQPAPAVVVCGAATGTFTKPSPRLRSSPTVTTCFPSTASAGVVVGSGCERPPRRELSEPGSSGRRRRADSASPPQSFLAPLVADRCAVSRPAPGAEAVGNRSALDLLDELQSKYGLTGGSVAATVRQQQQPASQSDRRTPSRFNYSIPPQKSDNAGRSTTSSVVEIPPGTSRSHHAAAGARPEVVRPTMSCETVIDADAFASAGGLSPLRSRDTASAAVRV